MPSRNRVHNLLRLLWRRSTPFTHYQLPTLPSPSGTAQGRWRRFGSNRLGVPLSFDRPFDQRFFFQCRNLSGRLPEHAGYRYLDNAVRDGLLS